MKISKIVRTKSFLVGFCFGIVGFIVANILYGHPEQRGEGKICFDCYETYGFPFEMHEYGTIAHLDQYIWSGVIANLTVAIVASVLLGTLFSLAYSKIVVFMQSYK
jgi:hypothetical protein